MDDIDESLLEFIANYCERFGFSPTARECGQWVGLRSSSTVQKRIDKLIAAGKLERREHFPRTLRLVK